MSELLGIREKLENTGAMIAHVERELATRPTDKALVLGLKSLEKRQQELESEFAEMAADMGNDLCRYRFLLNGEPAGLLGLSSSLRDYQLLLSVTYDAVASKTQRQTTKLSAETIAKTELQFGYSFAASVGFAFTIPNQRLIEVGTDLDEAFKVIASLVKATHPEEIKEFARRIGRGPVKALYRWAEAHLRAGLAADVQWGRGERVQARFLIQTPEFRTLTETIGQTSDEEREELKVSGVLHGADAKNQTFHFQPDHGAEIRGSLILAIDPSHTIELPKRYMAEITRVRVIYYSTGEERDQFELSRLSPL